MQITINGFNRYNPRRDLKSMPWLRLENDFYDKEDFYDEDVNTSWLFIFLLCQCAQKVSDTIKMDRKYLIHKSKLTEKQFNAALSRLLDKSLISLDTIESDRICTDSYLTNEQNEQNEQNEHDHERSSVDAFNIDAIYQEYPKKQGKAAGMKKLSQMKLDKNLYLKILHSAKSYAAYCAKMKIDNKYIKQFSTWVNQECWNDDYGTEESYEEKMLRFIGESNV